MHQQIIQLAIAYTLVGAFIFTVITTCFSLVGWVKFADQSQQRKLFYTLIVELVTIGVTFFGGFLNFNTRETTNQVVAESKLEYWKSVENKNIPSIAKPGTFSRDYQCFKRNANGEKSGSIVSSFSYDGVNNIYIETAPIPSIPPYYFRPVKIDGDFLWIYDDSRNYTLKLPVKSGLTFFSTDGLDGHFEPYFFVETTD